VDWRTRDSRDSAEVQVTIGRCILAVKILVIMRHLIGFALLVLISRAATSDFDGDGDFVSRADNSRRNQEKLQNQDRHIDPVSFDQQVMSPFAQIEPYRLSLSLTA
jgi:hypothetical protein